MHMVRMLLCLTGPTAHTGQGPAVESCPFLCVSKLAGFLVRSALHAFAWTLCWICTLLNYLWIISG